MQITKFATLEKKLIYLKNELVLLDKDGAFLYDIEPQKLRQQLKRNIEKPLTNYAYRLTDDEMEITGSQNVTQSKKHYGGTNPWALNGIIL